VTLVDAEVIVAPEVEKVAAKESVVPLANTFNIITLLGQEIGFSQAE
jgi:hypothetical protein